MANYNGVVESPAGAALAWPQGLNPFFFRLVLKEQLLFTTTSLRQGYGGQEEHKEHKETKKATQFRCFL